MMSDPLLISTILYLCYSPYIACSGNVLNCAGHMMCSYILCFTISYVRICYFIPCFRVDIDLAQKNTLIFGFSSVILIQMQVTPFNLF